MRQSVGARAERKRQYAVRGDGALLAELRLITALLEDAIHCFQRHLFARGRHNRQIYLDAEYWIMNERPNRIFSFEHVCETLGINPASLRYKLRRWREQQLASLRVHADLAGAPATDEAQTGARVQCGPPH